MFAKHPALLATGMILCLGWFTILLCVIALGFSAIFLGASAPHKLIAALVRKVRHHNKVRGYFRMLEEHGEVCLEGAALPDRAILREMARDDNELVYTDEPASLRPRKLGPPESCPRWMTQ